MEPGSELNALVAEKVMGLEVPGWALVQMNPECCGPSCGLVCEDDDHAEDPEGKCGLAYMKLPVYVDHCGCAELDVEEDYDYRRIERLGHYCSCLEVVPFYSEYIEPAWEVLEKLLPKHGDIEISSTGGRWYVGLECLSAECCDIEVVAETVHLGICLAALKAKGVEVQ